MANFSFHLPIHHRSVQLFALTWLAISVLTLSTGCQKWKLDPVSSRIQPSNDRNWKPEQGTLPFADVEGSTYELRNIRNCSYLSPEDYVVEYYDRQIELADVQSVDFIVVPFKKTPALAHTMLSFGLSDGSYLGVSVEVRKEIGEEYNAFAGLTRKFEIIYVLAEERDLIRLRTEHQDAEVYIYPDAAQPQQAQQLFADIVNRMNRLVGKPEFYNTVTNNCTTNLKDHVNQISPNRIQWNWRVLLPGFSARHAYDSGLLDNRIPFEDLKAIAYANELVAKYFDDPKFSQRIRSNREKIDRYARRESRRDAAFETR